MREAALRFGREASVCRFRPGATACIAPRVRVARARVARDLADARARHASHRVRGRPCRADSLFRGRGGRNAATAPRRGRLLPRWVLASKEPGHVVGTGPRKAPQARRGRRHLRHLHRRIRRARLPRHCGIFSRETPRIRQKARNALRPLLAHRRNTPDPGPACNCHWRRTGRQRRLRAACFAWLGNRACRPPPLAGHGSLGQPRRRVPPASHARRQPARAIEPRRLSLCDHAVAPARRPLMVAMRGPADAAQRRRGRLAARGARTVGLPRRVRGPSLCSRGIGQGGRTGCNRRLVVRKRGLGAACEPRALAARKGRHTNLVRH